MFCGQCGNPVAPGARFCTSCGNGVGSRGAGAAQVPPPALAAWDAEAQIISTIAAYEKISAVLWLIIGIVQVLSLVTIIAGAWNIYAAITRFRIAPPILARDERVPSAFEGVVGLIVIGAINLFLGGVIGVLFVAFDFYIRHLVLRNRHLFISKSATAIPL